jgi:hypothetical protein
MGCQTWGRVLRRLPVVVIAAVLAALPAIAKELKVATFLPPTHPIVTLYEQVGKEIAEESKGDLTFKVSMAHTASGALHFGIAADKLDTVWDYRASPSTMRRSAPRSAWRWGRVRFPMP